MESGERSRAARVVVADDHPSVLERIVALLNAEFDVVGTATDGRSLVDAEAADAIRRRGSRVAIVYVTAHREPELLDAALADGALGYVAKTCLGEDLVPAIRAAFEGRPYVSACLAPAAPRRR